MPLIKPTQYEKDLVCKAADLDDGESLFVHMATRKLQMQTFTQLNHAAREYCLHIDPSIVLTVQKTMQDGKLWLKITKDKAPNFHFVLGKDGKVRKTNV